MINKNLLQQQKYLDNYP